MIHLREIHSHTRTLCFEVMKPGEEATEVPERVTCPSCASRWTRLVEQFHNQARLLSLTAWLPVPPSASNLFEPGKSPAWRGELLDLLAQARAQGVHHLEVGADGSFKADMLPLPPPSVAPAKDAKAETPDEKLERELFPE